MRCLQCQHENASDAKFCNQCGSLFAPVCSACGRENAADAKFCNQCGIALTSAPSSVPSIHQETDSEITTQETSSTQSQPRPRDIQAPDAERRQLTVMFCDLVESTKLSGQLDPEELREIIRSYQRACDDVIQRFDGHVAQYLGDGLLVYFGYPVAHEDDAQRAVRTGLGIVEAIRSLNTGLEPEKDIKLAVRLGIHTGLVVVGEMGGDGRQEQLALGETPNIAARIQGLAEPNTLMVSEATYRLIQGYFDCEALGEPELRGVAQSIPVYQVLQESGAQSRLEVASIRGLTPLVGRHSELQLLRERWHQVTSGEGQVVLLNAEPGLGKSRMVQALREHLADEAYTRLECRSSPYYQNTALYPVIDLIQRMLQWEQDDSTDDRICKLDRTLSQYSLPVEETVPLMAGLLSFPLPEDKYPPLNMTPQKQRQQTLETIVAMLLELAAREPVFLIVEDLHWTDPSTLEWLGLLVDQIPTASIFILLTCRPEFQPEWGNRSYFTQITLNRLSHDDVEQMVVKVTGGMPLPDEVIQQLVDKTDGVPLYVEEMTKSVLESGVLQETNGHYELTGPISSLSIPATLQDSLMARLDRLVSAKGIAQLGATIGRQFSYELLQAVSNLDEAILQRELERLAEAELIYQRGVLPGATYIFKHALVQDTAYESLLRSTRQQYHQRIAQTLEERFPETAETQPELLAHHYTEARLNEEAVGYWHNAGQRASERSANAETISHLNKGLELLKTFPETAERVQQELALQVALGPALIAAKGYGAPEVERAYARARELCELVGDTAQLFPVLRGLMMYYQVRGRLHTQYRLGEQLLRLAQSQSDPVLLLLAHHQMGQVSFLRGAPVSARTHHAQALAIYNPQVHRDLALRFGIDIGLGNHSWLAWVLWQLGYPEQAMQHSQMARTLAQEVSHPFSLAHTLVWAAILHQHRREALAACEQAEAATTLATEQGFTSWVARGTVLHGWALAMQGQGEQGIAEIDQGLAAELAARAKTWEPYCLGLLAEAYGEDGHPEAGLNALDEALSVMDTMEVRFCAAELHRLKGQLLLQQAPDNSEDAESCFHQAIAIAQNQSAKSWELRATTSLARLWQSQDKRQDAYDLLAPVFEWFTEGFETADLKEAQALLSELGA